MGKKNRKNKQHGAINFPQRPNTYHSFVDCVKWLKKSVYIVVRGRKTIIEGKEMINWVTLGSGFVGAPNRFITAAHVINDSDKGEVFNHREGDKYYLLRHDDDDNWHYRRFEPRLDKEIFVYPKEDIAIIYLDNEFYQDNNQIYVNRNDYIRISQNLLPIGAEVGILGYPLCKLEFENENANKPKIGDILMRTEKGVLNCKYHTDSSTYLYEFTMAFNPGNSGGPIFDIQTGQVVSIVKGFRVNRTFIKENVITAEESKIIKYYKEKAYIEVNNANYSFGIATVTCIDIFKKHNIIST